MKKHWDRAEDLYVQRLVEEWKQHKKLIIAVDFDDTICSWKFLTQEVFDEVIKTIKEACEIGAYIVINTAGEKTRYSFMKSFCEENGITVDSINVNPINLPFGLNGKVYANLYLDERAGLRDSIKILKKSINIMENQKETYV